jgi:acyl-CoA thioesterase FadM
MLLGEMQAHVDRRVHVGESCTVIGWKIDADGRKHRAGTAIYDEDGVLCARAQATWIERG